MSYDPATCVGSTYNSQYWQGGFTTDSMPSHLNTAAKNVGINPATLATIASMETLYNDGSNGTTAECSPCGTNGAGVCQVGEAMFNEWNAYNGGGYTWCYSICGSYYPNNLEICAQFLYAAFYKLGELGITDPIQAMAMAGTAWNGHGSCGYNSNGVFYPWPGQTGFYLPGTDQLTEYGASAGYYFDHSGYVGNGVFDTSITLT